MSSTSTCLSQTSQARGHVVMFCLEAWGHTRPLCNLITKLVQECPVNVTLLTTRNFHSKVNAEISRSFGSTAAPELGLIRIICLPSEVKAGFMVGAEPDFAQAYIKLANSEALQCAVTGQTFAAIQAPETVILDFLALDALDAVRRHSVHRVKILGWQHGGATCAFGTYGPRDMGGQGDMSLVLEETAARFGRTTGQVLLYMVASLPGQNTRLPGMPAMYDYEFWPQPPLVPVIDEAAETVARGFRFLSLCDGLIQHTNDVFEPAAVQAWDKWFNGTGRSVYNVGPLLPEGAAAKGGEAKQSTESSAVNAYLADALEKHGAESVLYISFGSLWGPWEKPEKLWLLLDVLIECNVPFILSHSAPHAVIPDEIRAKVKGNGLLTPWAPQQTIFDHPATGWFLTHGGQNSVLEALSAGLPMILWDFVGDQTVNAIHLSENLGVACQLMEVRTGPNGTRKIARNGYVPQATMESARTEFQELLFKIRGPEGKEMRGRAQQMKRDFQASTTQGGSAHTAIAQLSSEIAC